MASNPYLGPEEAASAKGNAGEGERSGDARGDCHGAEADREWTKHQIPGEVHARCSIARCQSR